MRIKRQEERSQQRRDFARNGAMCLEVFLFSVNYKKEATTSTEEQSADEGGGGGVVTLLSKKKCYGWGGIWDGKWK